jgi:hypothetical protein
VINSKSLVAVLAGVAIGFAGTAMADDMGGSPIPMPGKPVTAAPPPHVELERVAVAAGIGLSWGDGTLLFEGERHAFSVNGVSLGDIGAAKAVASGRVQNLDKLSDFAGTYVAVEAGAAAGKGVSGLSMRNENGVVITLSSAQKGARLTLGAEGFRIALD